MAPKIRAQEIYRDDEFGILRKEISIPRTAPFETPTKCVKNLTSNIPHAVCINEVIKKITLKTIESIRDGTDTPRRNIFPKFLKDKINLTIFELVFDSVLEWNQIKSFASYWYASSPCVLFLPTVKMTMLKEDEKLSEDKIAKYMGMMRDFIELTEDIGNFKPFIGTIPLLPIKYSGPIVQLYHEKGITAFAIDGGTKDFLNHETDFRSILTEINEEVTLNEAFIYACNLGIPQFEAYRARADDFLSFFAYVDAFGTTFKTRGGPQMRGLPRVKRFLRNELSYEYIQGKKSRIEDFNQRAQLDEADVVRTLIGKEKMQTYLDSKSGVDSIAKRRLSSIAGKVKIK